MKDWLTDWDWIMQSSLTLKRETSTDAARKYFRSRYHDVAEADWKLDRQLRAYHYVEKHIASFEEASLAISSSKQATIGRQVNLALFRFFSHATDEQVVNEPPPEIMVAAAKEHEND
ncbi:MAG TPA: hypothetical protein VNY07_03185 [Chthoniobacterales bacterium]|nr:hypothetical protein [Chthoniobacterales bacterium]